jgi:hypothetical protein
MTHDSSLENKEMKRHAAASDLSLNQRATENTLIDCHDMEENIINYSRTCFLPRLISFSTSPIRKPPK